MKSLCRVFFKIIVLWKVELVEVSIVDNFILIMFSIIFSG
jgi:hypothetical protein